MRETGSTPRRWMARWCRLLANRLPAASEAEAPQIDLYGGAMTREYNWLHRAIFPRFFRRIRVSGAAPDLLRDRAAEGTLVYIAPSIGQLEYNFFNYFLVQQRLPLARFVNELQTTWWRPWCHITRIWQRRCATVGRAGVSLPHPVRSGYLQQLLTRGECVCIRLKTSQIYDDLLWDDPEDDPLIPLLRAQRAGGHFHLVPMQFFWDRRPDRVHKGLVDLLFGERDYPGRIRKFVLFWRNYKNRAAAHIGDPIALAQFLAERPHRTDPELARELRHLLLGVIQRERRSTTGPALKPRRWILDHVCETERVHKVIYGSARETGKPVTDFQQLARRYADEIIADIHFSYIEFAAWVLRWIFRNVYKGFTVDESGLAEVKRAMAEGPTILVPSHRSHIDYLLISYVLYLQNMAMPHCAAGINMAFWPAGPFFRRCGGFFLRRTFGKNPLYRAVFEEYLALLIREKYCVEFFIEGGRSRTGKSLQPRMGILSMLTQAMREGVVPDLKFIPVAITYDQVIEQRAYLQELAGGTKPPERGWHLLHLGRYLRRRYGHIYLNLGEPISFAEAVRALLPHAASPQAISDAEKPRVVQHVAHTIMYAINKETVVTPAALAATALLLPLKRAVTEAEVREIVEQLWKYLEWKGVTFSASLRDARHAALHEALEGFATGPTRPISRHGTFQPVCYAIEESRRIQLDYSKNTTVHFFVSLACLAVILRTHFLRGDHEVPMFAIEADYERCKQLFRFEFAFSTRFQTIAHIRRILTYLGETSLVELSDGKTPRVRVTPPGATRLRLFSGLLRNFFESYKIALLVGPNIPPGGLDAKALVKLMIRYGQHLLLLGEIRCPEAISQANFQNAIEAYTAMGILTAPSETGKGKALLIWRGNHPETATLQQALEEWC